MWCGGEGLWVSELPRRQPRVTSLAPPLGLLGGPPPRPNAPPPHGPPLPTELGEDVQQLAGHDAASSAEVHGPRETRARLTPECFNSLNPSSPTTSPIHRNICPSLSGNSLPSLRHGPVPGVARVEERGLQESGWEDQNVVRDGVVSAEPPRGHLPPAGRAHRGAGSIGSITHRLPSPGARSAPTAAAAPASEPLAGFLAHLGWTALGRGVRVSLALIPVSRERLQEAAGDPGSAGADAAQEGLQEAGPEVYLGGHERWRRRMHSAVPRRARPHPDRRALTLAWRLRTARRPDGLRASPHTDGHAHARPGQARVRDPGRSRSSTGKTRSVDGHSPGGPSQHPERKGVAGIARRGQTVRRSRGWGLRKSGTEEEPARKGTHIVVFLSDQRWLRGLFWGSHLHLQLGDLGRDARRKKPRSARGPSSCSLPCPRLSYCRQGTSAPYWCLRLPRVRLPLHCPPLGPLEPMLSSAPCTSPPCLSVCPGHTLSWAFFRVSSSIQGSLLRRATRASLMAVNNSMACGREAVGIGNWEEDQPQCWVLPA